MRDKFKVRTLRGVRFAAADWRCWRRLRASCTRTTAGGPFRTGREGDRVPAAHAPRGPGERVRLHQLRSRRPPREARPPSADGKLTRSSRRRCLRGPGGRRTRRVKASTSCPTTSTSTPTRSCSPRRSAASTSSISMSVDGTEPQAADRAAATTTSTRLYLPGGKILFMTNQVEPLPTRLDSAVHATSTSAQTTAQVGDHQPRRQRPACSGARNVSHRVSPALLPDGHFALHRVAAHGHGQRRPPAHDEHRHDRHARGVRRRGRRQRPAPTATSRPATSRPPMLPIRTAAARRSRTTRWSPSPPRATARCSRASCS